MVLADTNILIHFLYPKDTHHNLVRASFETLYKRGEDIVVAPQNLIEFWATATRPLHYNGLGLTSSQAVAEISILKTVCRLLPYKSNVFDIWQRLVNIYNIVGKQTHDAHLVAFMQAHGVSTILTFNGAHFTRYPGITVLDPAQV